MVPITYNRAGSMCLIGQVVQLLSHCTPLNQVGTTADNASFFRSLPSEERTESLLVVSPPFDITEGSTLPSACCICVPFNSLPSNDLKARMVFSLKMQQRSIIIPHQITIAQNTAQHLQGVKWQDACCLSFCACMYTHIHICIRNMGLYSATF